MDREYNFEGTVQWQSAGESWGLQVQVAGVELDRLVRATAYLYVWKSSEIPFSVKRDRDKV